MHTPQTKRYTHYTPLKALDYRIQGLFIYPFYQGCITPIQLFILIKLAHTNKKTSQREVFCISFIGLIVMCSIS